MRGEKISICITTRDRPELTIKSFDRLLDDTRIAEVVIVDDYSTPENYEKLCDLMDFIQGMGVFPVRLIRNTHNLGMQVNKAKAVSASPTEWCILLDSDNSIDKSFIDSIFNCNWAPDTMFCPSFAKPHFDYTAFQDIYYDADNVKVMFAFENFMKHLNTCNYFVHVQKYLGAYRYNESVKGADTIWFAYNWLKNGNGCIVIPGMHYNHSVHPGSEWRKDLEGNRKKAKEIELLIRELE